MSKASGDRLPEALAEQMRFSAMEHASDRRRVIAIASRMVDTLEDKDPNMMSVARLSRPIEPGLSSAPEEVPHFHWKDTLGDGVVGRVGDFGALLVNQFNNERPGQIANAAFYAGVLAAKAGLVDVESFRRDTDADSAAEVLPTE